MSKVPTLTDLLVTDREEMDKSQWAELLEMAFVLHIRTAWEIADLLVWGIDHFTDGSADQIADLYGEISEQLECSKKTLQNYERVARRFGPDNRFGAPLSLGHHDAVMGQSDELAYEWLQLAWSYGWSVSRLRVEIGAGNDKPEPVELPNPIAIERAFYRSGIRTKVGKRRVTFTTAAGELVLTSESDIHWSTHISTD